MFTLSSKPVSFFNVMCSFIPKSLTLLIWDVFKQNFILFICLQIAAPLKFSHHQISSVSVNHCSN
jgi:hypothetical protein